MTGDLHCLSGKTALVFGGTGGIGLACVKAYAGAGARSIMIVGRNRERGEATLCELRALFGNTEFELAIADASTFSGAESAVKACVESFGGAKTAGVDILLSTAGGDPMPRLFHEMPPELVEHTIKGSLLSAIYPAKAVLPLMMEQKQGVILTMASDAGKVATPGETVIGAAMAGLIMFSRALANEVKRWNIRVNCISPSIVRNTSLYDNLMSDPFGGKLFSKAEKMATLGVVEPEDLAALALYLSSPAAAKLSGQAISLNGGISMA
jgi:NAD(P)-dependent dehydrogenase (short-subunit alcohol dehydrogenase family)